jgi:23S rRNA (cytosine1962-C5)-methyltransferase
LTPPAERAVKKGHPWVFESSILKIKEDVKTGDFAIIFDSKLNQFLAIGIIDAESIIRIKIISAHNRIDLQSEWVKERLDIALQKRSSLFQTTNAFRWCYGESDLMPGLVIDVFDHVAVIKLYSSIWFQFIEDIKTAITSLWHVDTIIIRFARISLEEGIKQGYKDGEVIFGTLTKSEIRIEENGVKFLIDPIHGHKTGFFLDHRQNRIAIGKLSKGKSVLDVFSYAGGFSMHALVGGAKEVVSLDISKHAIQAAEKNASINSVSSTHQTVCSDAFKQLEEYDREGKQFDIIIIDPPSMAKSKTEIDKAIKKYTTLAAVGAKLLTKGGTLLLASCSSKVNKEAFLNANQLGFNHSKQTMTFQKFVGHDVDHPDSFSELSYLKAAYYIK